MKIEDDGSLTLHRCDIAWWVDHFEKSDQRFNEMDVKKRA